MSFSHSQSNTLYNPSFTDIQGDLNIHHGNTYNASYTTIHPSEAGLSSLLRAASVGATYDSQERHPPPRCYPGTRKEVLDEIECWIKEGAKERGRVCWLHGPAGAGKSAIAQTFAETCAERGQLAASFFFSRSAPGRNTIQHLFTTIALQIALSSPDRRLSIQKAVEEDPLIVHKATSVQLNKLFVEPLQPQTELAEDITNEPFLIIIDGLDECKGNNDQSLILSHITYLTHTCSLPLRFLIISRPEPHIQHAFDDTILNRICTKISLYGTWKAREDIYAYLRGQFEKIHNSERHADIMKFVPKPWPSADVLRLLTQRSGGYFVYASTVLKYVDEEYFSCTARLHEILNSSDSDSTAFAEMDNLYLQVLSTCPNPNLLSRILGCVLNPLKRVENPSNIEAILDLQPGEVMLTLRGLHSILKVQPYSIGPFHASFQDFLFDRGRAGKYFIDAPKCHEDIVRGSLNLISNWQRRWDAFGDDTTFGREFGINRAFGIWVQCFPCATNQVELCERMRDCVTRGSWKSFVLYSGCFSIKAKSQVVSMLAKATHTFQNLASPPQDLVDHFIMLCDLALQSYISPDSLAETRYIQDIYTILEFYTSHHTILPMSFSNLLELHNGPLPTYRSDNFCNLSKSLMLKPSVTRDIFIGFMNNPTRCGALYRDSGDRNSRLAQFCIRFLTRPTSRKRLWDSDEYHYAKKYWAKYVSLSSPGDLELIHHLQKPWKLSEGDLASAKRVVDWLKGIPNPPNLLTRWEKYYRKAHYRLRIDVNEETNVDT